MKKIDNILKLSLDELKSLYIISSEDRYILSDFKEKFVEKFIDEDIRDFNFTYIEEREDLPLLLKNQVNTPPIMSDKRFIIVRTSAYFTAKQGKEELIVSLFNNYPDTTITLILVDGKINNRLKIVKDAKEIGDVLKVSAPKYAELDKWILTEFKKRGKNIDHSSVKFLEQMFNNNLQRLESEIDKIILYKINKDMIKLEDILQIVSKDKLIEDSLVFKLTDALMLRKKGEAVKVLRQMLDGGAIPLVILGTITWQIRLLLSVKILKEKGNNIGKIARILKSHQYPVKKCYKYSDNFSEKELEDILERLLEANKNIVTGIYIPELALEMAIIA